MLQNTGRTAGGDVSSLCCPLLLFSGETVSELASLLQVLKSGGYMPLSLQELFLCRRGVRRWPSKPFAVLLREVSLEELRAVLPVLQAYEIPAALFLREALPDRDVEELSRCGFLGCFAEAELFLSGTLPQYFASVRPGGNEFHTAVFCEKADAELFSVLRKNGVRMMLTVCGTVFPEPVPSGIDLLYAVRVAKGSSLPELLARCRASLSVQAAASPSVFLPLAKTVAFSDLELAIPLSILGARPEQSQCFLAGADWNPAFDPAAGRYWLRPSWSGVIDERKERTGKDPLPLIHRALQNGVYVRLQTRGFRVPGRRPYSPGSLLLFGFDGGYGAFSAMTALEPGAFERVDLLPETLARLCGDPACTLILLTYAGERLPCRLTTVCDRIAAGFQRETGKDDICSGWQASVLFVNWLERSPASAQTSFPAASVRTFLEERLLTGFRLRYFEQQADLFLEPLERYTDLLEREARRALCELRGRETLSPGQASFLLLCDLLRRLLNAEEACLRALLAEAERADAMEAFRRSREHTETSGEKR